MPFLLRGRKGSFPMGVAAEADAYFMLLSFESSLTVALSS